MQIYHLSATELVNKIKSKEISSKELTQLYIDRIKKYDDDVNAVVIRMFDKALEDAKKADEALSNGIDLGPLHGLPMTIKESYAIEGHKTTWGNEAFKNNTATADGLAVQRFKDAGAHFMGKTNVPLDLADFQSYNTIYGTTNNPWDLKRIPGGSSGGSAAALAAGNSVVLKPAEQSPLSALRLAELTAEAGIPAGVFNVVPGYGQTAGRALGLNMDVDCLAFTGSTAIGKMFMQYSGQSNLKQIWPETGGKSPNIVFADSENLEEAANMAAFGIFFNQGEVCSANSRLYVEKSIKQEFVALLKARAEVMQPGDPLDPKSKMGAIVDEKQTNVGYA